VHELERLGCRLGQGFYFARPLDARSFEGFFGADRAA
jgi:EAL domain-containing protein (putative c-di-GMP-specific phosphodiesterase class I)